MKVVRNKKKPSRLKKDGTPDLRYKNGGNKTAGRKSKAEELGLKKRLQKNFRAVEKTGFQGDGADAVLQAMWKIALDDEHPKQTEMLLYLDKRFFGKEPKAIIQENIDGKDKGSITDIFGGTFEENKKDGTTS